MKIVDIINSQNIVLRGCLYDTKNKNLCILFIPGMAGNIIENKFIQILGEELQKNDIGFLCGHNQGSFHIVDYPCNNNNGFVRRGVTYEKFEDCLPDISAYINYIKKLGYKKIVLAGHSLGANKVIYYLSKNKPDLIKAYILLGPPDMVAELNSIEDKDDLILEAKTNISNHEPNKLLSKLIWDYYILSSATFIDLVENKNLHNLPITSHIGSFDALKSIKLPFLAIAGEKDDSCSNNIEIYLSSLISNANSNGEYAIIKNANHTYINQEKELFNVIHAFINKIF